MGDKLIWEADTEWPIATRSERAKLGDYGQIVLRRLQPTVPGQRNFGGKSLARRTMRPNWQLVDPMRSSRPNPTRCRRAKLSLPS
jgi:hypothetical protein